MSDDTEQATPEPVEATEASDADEVRWLEMGAAAVRATLIDRVNKLLEQADHREAQVTPERYAMYQKASNDMTVLGRKWEAREGKPDEAEHRAAYMKAADAVDRLGNEIRFNESTARALRAEANDLLDESGPTFRRLVQDERDRIRRAETVNAAARRRKANKAERDAEAKVKLKAKADRLAAKNLGGRS